MASILTDALPVFVELAPALTRPTFQWAQLLVVAAVLATGRRIIANLLRTLGTLVPGRAAPCLLGLYTLVSVRYWQLPASVKEDWGVLWTSKEAMTFSDAITAVRRWLWSDWVFATGGHDVAFAKLPNALQEVLLAALTPAA